MLGAYLGEISALLASICFSIGPTLNTFAGQRVSVNTVNRARLVIALGLLVIPHWLVLGVPIPLQAPAERWVWLGLSGLCGLVLGDTLLFLGFSLIGTRLSMLVATLVPVLSSILAWAFLGERLAWVQAAGILTTLLGVAWVMSDRNGVRGQIQDRAAFRRGIQFTLAAAFIHSIGNILAKKGLVGDFPALSGHVMRVTVSLVIILGVMLLQRQLRPTLSELKAEPSSLRYILWGAVFGPTLGMWLSLFAIQNTEVGVASSLTALPPIWLLPIGHYLFSEKISLRSVAGSLVAVAGVVLIFVF
jgi:drug/metabolite transporter (DMT)-like permease